MSILSSITILSLIFYLFSAVAVISALIVITARHPVKSVLSLVITFFAMAGIWMMLQAEFLSLILLLVYVGAVMTLFLFVIMMLNVDREEKQTGWVRYYPFGLAITTLMTIFILLAFQPNYFGEAYLVPAHLNTGKGNLEQLGNVLYTDYAYPFEIAGVLLLVAIIAAISLTHRAPRRLVQHPNKQINIDPKTRIRLINMPADTEYRASTKREDT